MSLQITGKLIEKYDVQQVSEKFKKREFVMEVYEEYNGQTYTNFAKLQLVQAKCDIIDRYNIGDSVTVSFNVKGNKWEKDGKINYITNLDCWRIEAAQGSGSAAPPATATATVHANKQTPTSFNVPNSVGPETIDDLPF